MSVAGRQAGNKASAELLGGQYYIADRAPRDAQPVHRWSHSKCTLVFDIQSAWDHPDYLATLTWNDLRKN
jgi:hypothetical protein